MRSTRFARSAGSSKGPRQRAPSLPAANTPCPLVEESTRRNGAQWSYVDRVPQGGRRAAPLCRGRPTRGAHAPETQLASRTSMDAVNRFRLRVLLSSDAVRRDSQGRAPRGRHPCPRTVLTSQRFVYPRYRRQPRPSDRGIRAASGRCRSLRTRRQALRRPPSPPRHSRLRPRARGEASSSGTAIQRQASVTSAGACRTVAEDFVSRPPPISTTPGTSLASVLQAADVPRFTRA